MNERAAVPEEGILGFKKADFTTPDKVLGQEIRIEELPDGIKFFLRGQAVNLSEKRIIVNLYELVREDGGAKLRREFLEKFINRIPEEEEIALKYGPSEEGYIWIAKWRGATGDEKGVMSDTIRVSEKWRARHEEAQRKARGVESLPAAPSPAAPAPAPAAWGPLEVMKLLQEGEDRAFRNMERMAGIFKGANGQAPEAVMVKAYEAAGSIMERAMESNLAMGKKVSKVVERRIEGEDDPDDGAVAGGAPEPDPMEAVPAFIRPFLPQLETWLGTLLGGGPMGAAVKTLILSSEQWKEIFGDKEKFGLAVAAMEQHFGSERTQKAMDILLNRRATGKAKGK